MGESELLKAPVTHEADEAIPGSLEEDSEVAFDEVD